MIDAFNADIPYDRFLHEQIAGDILAARRPDRRLRPPGHRHRVRRPGEAVRHDEARGHPPDHRGHAQHDRARSCSASRSGALAATTTSSTRSRHATITPSTASSPAPSIRSPGRRRTASRASSPPLVPAGPDQGVRGEARRATRPAQCEPRRGRDPRRGREPGTRPGVRGRPRPSLSRAWPGRADRDPGTRGLEG